MEIKQVLLKQMAILSAILGLVLGVLTVIPIIGQFAFFALVVLATPIIFVYMKKLDMIGILDIKQGAIYGAVVGFAAFIAFAAHFGPLPVSQTSCRSSAYCGGRFGISLPLTCMEHRGFVGSSRFGIVDASRGAVAYKKDAAQ